MKTGTLLAVTSKALCVGLVVLAGVFSDSQPVRAQTQVPCPLPDGATPVAPPLVTAQQVENGTGSLMDFALSSRDRFREQAQQATTPGRSLYFACLIRQDESPWRSGSTYLVTLTPDGRVFIHAKDMSLSGRLLKRSIYGGILKRWESILPTWPTLLQPRPHSLQPEPGTAARLIYRTCLAPRATRALIPRLVSGPQSFCLQGSIST